MTLPPSRTPGFSEIDLDDGVWFRFEHQVDLATQGEYGGIRQTYRAGIGQILKDLKKAQVVHFDVGLGDPVTPEPRSVETDSLIIPRSNLSWLVYPVETIIAEKMHALVSHGDINSRSKDVYDLAFLLPKADADHNCGDRFFTRTVGVVTISTGVEGGNVAVTIARILVSEWLTASTVSTSEAPSTSAKRSPACSIISNSLSGTHSFEYECVSIATSSLFSVDDTMPRYSSFVAAGSGIEATFSNASIAGIVSASGNVGEFGT